MLSPAPQFYIHFSRKEVTFTFRVCIQSCLPVLGWLWHRKTALRRLPKSAHVSTDMDFWLVLCPDETKARCLHGVTCKEAVRRPQMVKMCLSLLNSTCLQEDVSDPLSWPPCASCVSPGCSQHPYLPTPPPLSQSCHFTTSPPLSLTIFQTSHHKTSRN